MSADLVTSEGRAVDFKRGPGVELIGCAPDVFSAWEIDQLGEMVFGGVVLPDGHKVRCREEQLADPAFLARVQAEYLARREAEDAG